MLRSLLPFTLALIGLSMLFIASINPLFEWEISEVVSDFPSSYEIQFMSPSPWKAYLGESLNDRPYVFQKIFVLENRRGCSVSEINIVMNRSRKDELLERLTLTRLFNHDNHDWIIDGMLIEIALAVAYSFWFTIWREHRPISDVIISVVLFVICFCLILMPVMRVMGPKVMFWNGNVNCHGTITLSAKLLEVNYMIAIISPLGIILELSALAIMLYEVSMEVKKKVSSKAIVG